MKKEINKDIRDQKDKLIGPFSFREIACLLIGFGFYAFIKGVFLSNIDMVSDVNGFLFMFCMVPFVFVGWGKIYGMKAEVFLKSCLGTFLSPKHRKYKNELIIKRKEIKTKKSKDKDLQPLK